VNVSDSKFNPKKNDDGFITASFWLFFAIGRLISIFIATKFTPLFMILVDIVSFLFFVRKLYYLYFQKYLDWMLVFMHINANIRND
jgi:hypothetical protein